MYKIEYEKFNASVWKDDIKIRGFSCYDSKTAWEMAEKFLLEELKAKYENNNRKS